MIRLIICDDALRLKGLIEKESQDFELVNFDGRLDSLRVELMAQTFFGSRRLFLVRGKLVKTSSAEEAILGELLKEDYADKIFFIEEKEPTKKVLDLFKKHAGIESLTALKGNQLIDFIKIRVHEEDSDIAPLAAERLSGFVGGDLWQLEEEIKKLVLYKRESGEPIQTADVDLLVHANFQANIFNLVDAIGTKNTKKANQLLNSSAKEVKKNVTAGKLKEAETALKEAYSKLDKAAKRNVIHKNNASRRKSRLAALLKPAEKKATK